MRSRAVLGLIAFLLALGAERADAGFRVCNQFEQRLSIAFGYVDRARGWVAQGWWVIDTNQCTSLYAADLDNRYYYILAKPTAGGPDWKGGKVPFCIQEQQFVLVQAQYGKDTPEECAKAGLESALFISVDVGAGEKNHTFTFGGSAPAVQRLPNVAPAATTQPPAQPPVAVAPRPAPPVPPGGGGTACQRYPNLC
jgi:uncharacterized membrane protein